MIYELSPEAPTLHPLLLGQGLYFSSSLGTRSSLSLSHVEGVWVFSPATTLCPGWILPQCCRWPYLQSCVWPHFLLTGPPAWTLTWLISRPAWGCQWTWLVAPRPAHCGQPLGLYPLVRAQPAWGLALACPHSCCSLRSSQYHDDHLRHQELIQLACKFGF